MGASLCIVIYVDNAPERPSLLEYGALLGLFRDNGKGNGNYSITIGYILGL